VPEHAVAPGCAVNVGIGKRVTIVAMEEVAVVAVHPLALL